MTTAQDSTCCGGDSCCTPAGVNRRAFLALSTLATAGGMLGVRAQAAAALGVPENMVGLVPADKGLTAEQLAQLARRGAPTAYEGAALKTIGMPVGGATAGRVYLGGDGKLWLWDVNNPAAAVSSGWVGGSYSEPLQQTSPFRQGFALRTKARGKTRTSTLDANGFSQVTFTGQYPLGKVRYADPDSPVEVTLEAFSPFVPTNLDDSSLPATICSYTVRNKSHSFVEATLAGWSENPICIEGRLEQPTLLRSAKLAGGVQFSAAPGAVDPDPEPDILFEDFEGTTYDGWTVEGTAFGPGPVTPESTPDYFRRFGDLHVHGTRFVTSHAFWDAGGNPDGLTGKLISREFTIERGYVTAGVGGGHWAGQTCFNVVVDGNVVASVAGRDMEPLATRVLDVRRYRGKQARIELVDSNTGGWGHINCDYIVFTDKPPVRPIESFPDHGTFALAALDGRPEVLAALREAGTTDAIFDAPAGATEVDASLGTITGAVRVPLKLAPGQSTTVRFALAWHFPVPRDGQFSALEGAAGLRHHYATRFDSASAVLRYVGQHRRRLEDATRAWVDTWYDDSTLPHWFLERTLAPASTVATTTCYRFNDGRFYAMEGEYCCDGTCQHVWNYAQSIARLFPELERDARERVDLGIGFHADTGAMDYRGEYAKHVAVDGQAGTVLRIYREHQMCADSAFLRRTWPRVKLAIEHLIGRDGAPANGVLEAEQYNTLDASWYGEIPWITGLYIACLSAGAAMATEMGDTAFASRCSALATAGSAYLDKELWSDEYGYYFHKLDPTHPKSTNSNRGCFADQLYGQTYARQLGLPGVVSPDKARSALRALYRNNFVSDHEAFRAGVDIPGGRWYAEQGEAGLLMCTWPFGGDDEAPGGGDPGFVAYLNEVWTGQEYQVAAGLFAEGLAQEGLVLTRAVFDRYDARKRNPYNEIECSDHYARAMMSHAVYLAALGYEYHGPLGRLGFAPKLTPEKFQAAFTAAEGWGTYSQSRSRRTQAARVQLRYGKLRLTTLIQEVAGRVRKAEVRIGQRKVAADVSQQGNRVEVILRAPVTLRAGESLDVSLEY